MPKHGGQKYAQLCGVSKHQGQRKDPSSFQREKEWVICKETEQEGKILQ